MVGAEHMLRLGEGGATRFGSSRALEYKEMLIFWPMNSFLLTYSMVRLMITCAILMKLYYGKQCRSPQNAFVQHRVVIITIPSSSSSLFSPSTSTSTTTSTTSSTSTSTSTTSFSPVTMNLPPAHLSTAGLWNRWGSSGSRPHPNLNEQSFSSNLFSRFCLKMFLQFLSEHF